MKPLTVSGTLGALSAIAEYVKAAAKAAGLERKAAYRLRLAVDEIATNIIVYGYQKAGREGVVDLRADIDEHTLTISIEDNGVAFDPLQQFPREEETLALPFEERPIGGLGLYLAIQSVDQFFYERSGERNRNILVVNRTKA
jgi:anti-sigma regulatory factor (Ser/Thr protein kinase)